MDLEFERFDLKLGNDIREPFEDREYTHIFHLAARKSVPDGEVNAREFISTNCWGTVNLLKSYPHARIINVSSSSANEPKSIYGMTKLFAEQAGNTHKNCLSVRLYNVFGEGQRAESGALIPRLLHYKKYGGIPTLYADGQNSRDFTYVGDVVHFLIWAMMDTKFDGLTHYGYGEPMKVKDVAERILGKDFAYHNEAQRSFEIFDSCAPVTGHPHRYGREEGLKRTIAHHDNA